MSAQSGTGLFVVDNSISGWSGIRYLREWTEVARSMDIATGYFEIGALLELDGHWQKLEKIRILMGSEMTHRTRRVLVDSLNTFVKEKLDGSIEGDKDKNPFLEGVPAIVEALKSGQIECRAYTKGKFHAKGNIYIQYSES